MTEERETLVRLRLERAWETLAEAELLAEAGHWNGCVNRLYYACFYAVSALLLRHGLASAKHSGVIGLFNRHFVKTGGLGRDLGALYNDLFQSRQRGDYDDTTRFDESRVRPWIDEARRLISEIEAVLAHG